MNEPAHNPFALDRALVRRSFDRASERYDRSAVLQAEVRKVLLDRLELVRLDPEVIADIGCGTGHASRALKRRYPRARVVALDLSPAMLRAAHRQQGFLRRFQRVCADAARLPFAEASIDLLYCNLMLQWCNDPDAVFAEFRRVLRPHGLLTFSSFGPDTLRELRQAWSTVDEHTHVNQFLDMHDVGDALVRAGLAEPVLDVERFTLTYDDTFALMRDLKAIGAHNVTAGRPLGLTGRGTLARMSAAYETFRREGKLPATYEVVFGQAWGRATEPARSREAQVPLSSIGRRSRT
jgi:malonyl-CoA O-methyltransferase